MIGNSASGHDLAAELVTSARLPVYQSRRSASWWEGPLPPSGQVWKPIITEFISEGPHAGRIVFEDDTYLDDIDTVIYCTGYKASFPFWNARQNGCNMYNYENNKLEKTYLHTFFHNFPRSLGIVGMPRVLTFRSFEYQAIALARVFAGRDNGRLPNAEAMVRWESETWELKGKNFHYIDWESGETERWLGELFDIAGLGLLSGEGRTPPRLSEELRWAVENIKKYPKYEGRCDAERELVSADVGSEGCEWVVVDLTEVEGKGTRKDLLAFI